MTADADIIAGFLSDLSRLNPEEYDHLVHEKLAPVLLSELTDVVAIVRDAFARGRGSELVATVQEYRREVAEIDAQMDRDAHAEGDDTE
jgi:hypothetical protein